ncbi:hypothetical protein [Escherichia coli]|nr:hypothetical protein [Escherichia coli]
MADIIDSASEIEELQRNTAIKMRRLNHQHQKLKNYSATQQ